MVDCLIVHRAVPRLGKNHSRTYQRREASGRTALLIVTGAMGALLAVPGNAQVNSVCEALKGADFTRIQDAATEITATRGVPADSKLPAHCVVEGYVWPNVGFMLQLPVKSDWNRKFAEMGPGGYGGTLQNRAEWCEEALRRGYACITHNTGHVGATRDATWAYNNLQAELDYGIRAAHVIALAGKEITKHFYDAPPKYSYFMGCSGGGKQALVQAQRFPWDFDGVIAVEPSNVTITGVTQLWNGLAMHDAKGRPLFSPQDLKVLHEAAINTCDSIDGIKDGVIGGDPRRCKFDPEVLLCKSGQKKGCLSAAQIDAAKKVYDGPVTSEGRKLYFPSLVGSELGTYFTMNEPAQSIQYKTSYWQYLGFYPDPGPSWKATDFDFDKDWKRSYVMDAVLTPMDNPDLRKLRDEGNKLMVVQGWEDAGLPAPLAVPDYYEMVERVMGGRAQTQEFIRLFMIPGRSHCRGGVGAASIDMLSYMEAWVEEGKAPDMLIGAHIEGVNDKKFGMPGYYADYLRLPENIETAKFTRPHFPYPLEARYRGAGDPNDYRNFVAIEPDHHAE